MLPAEPSGVLVVAFHALTFFLLAGWVLAAVHTGRRPEAPLRGQLRQPARVGWWLVGGVLVALVYSVLPYVAAGQATFHLFNEVPPPVLVMFMSGLLVVVALGVSRVGRAMARVLSFDVLVGFQAFRIAVEILIHRAYIEGLAPIQMTYEGRNFDLLTGILAVVIVIRARRRPIPVWLLWSFDLLGLALLINVLTTAILSMPTPFQVFTNAPDNVWVAYRPFVWLPTVMVTSAVFGHILLTRKLLATAPESDAVVA